MRKIAFVILFILTSIIAFSQCSTYQVFVTSYDVSCNGYNDGSVIVDSVGGTAPYQYFWQGPNGFNSSNSNLTNLFPGTYQLTVVDSNNCQSISAITVINEPNFSINLNSSNVSCNGFSDGSITVNTNGGVAPFNYSWNPTNNNSTTINNLSVGTYNVVVTDANGCVKSDSTLLTQPDSLLIALDFVINVSCNGGNDGEIKILPNGGMGSYSYFWVGPNNYVNPNNTKRISFLYAGTYTVTITDQNNCQNSLSINVAQPSVLSLSPVIQNISCFGNQDGSISVAANGGVSPYLYLWNTSDTLSSIDSLLQGNYNITITDFNNCQLQQNFQISEPNPITTTTLISDVLCNTESNGQIDVTTIGGISPYYFSWSNGMTSEDISNINAGNYSLTITDNNSCIHQEFYSVSEPTPILFSVDSITDVECFGQNSGSVWVSSIGGIFPYTFSWSDSLLNAPNRTNLLAGNYTAFVIDSNFCTDSLAFTINQSSEIQISASITPHLCYGDSSAGITIDSSFGGVGTLSYNWSNGMVNTQLNNLIEDSLTLVVSDSINCSKQFDFLLPKPSAISINFSTTLVSCNGFSDGSIVANVSGGSGVHQYLWSTNDTISTISNLPQGYYTLNISDSNNCTQFDSVAVVSPSVLLSVFSTTTFVSCNGFSDGVLAVNSTGGTPPYSYNWSNAGSGNIQDSLVAGSYIVTTADANNCTTTNLANISEPNAITAFVQTIDVSCFGANDGEIQLGINGGTPPFSHQWSNGDFTEDIIVPAGIYTDSITDNNGCKTIITDSVVQPQAIGVLAQINDVSCFGNNDGNINLVISGGIPPFAFSWQNGASTSFIDSLFSGEYIVQITDNNNCTRQDSFLIIQPLSAIGVSAIINNPSCFSSSDGQINISVNGGVLPYQYLWSNNSTSEDISNLTVGNYSVAITDSNGCVETQMFVVSQPDSMDVIISSNDISCFGANDGTASAIVNGGFSPYQFNWSNGGTQNQTSLLQVGNHSVIVSDSNNCSKSASFTISEPSILLVNVSPSDISCFGANDGVLSAVVSGGTSPYLYNWSNGGNSSLIDSLPDGLYSLTITDANQCNVVGFGIIQEPNQLLYTTAISDVKCFGGNDGMIDLTVSGGTPPFNFLWSNFSTNQDLMGVSAGDYSVVISDVNNCEISVFDTINQPNAPISVLAIINDVNCFGADNGAIDLSISGGTLPYSFIWSNGFTSEDISSLSPSYYSVVILDANNCTENYGETIGSVAEISINSTIKNESCAGSNDGEISIQINGGISPYSILWANGDTTNNIYNLSANSYNVSISDSINCSTIESVVISAGQSILMNSEIQNVKCFGDSSGSILLDISGGVSPYTVLWNDGDTSAFKTNLFAGLFTVFVTDSIGCQSDVIFNISEPIALNFNIYGDNASCTGINDGNVFTDVSGGTVPYLFLWNDSSTFSDLIEVVPGIYNVEITDSNLCKIGASFEVLIDEDCINIPTAFTPNGDGVNDFWHIRNIENFQSVEVSVFDANGFVYFTSSNYDNSWGGEYKGEKLKAGIYYYHVKMVDETFTGSITIVR